MDRCTTCGFAWDDTDVGAVERRLEPAVDGIVAALERTGVFERPSESRWSTVEYACHVRDVLLVMRERTILALTDADPLPQPMHHAERVQIGLYQGVLTEELATELLVAGSMLLRLIATLSSSQLERTIPYSWPRAAHRSLAWLAAQALHEAEHHLSDIEWNERTLGDQQ